MDFESVCTLWGGGVYQGMLDISRVFRVKFQMSDFLYDFRFSVAIVSFSNSE